MLGGVVSTATAGVTETAAAEDVDCTETRSGALLVLAGFEITADSLVFTAVRFDGAC